jgi:hypothetical protein
MTDVHTKGGRREMRIRLLVAGIGATAAIVAGGVSPAFAHEGGHAGGCADFGVSGNVPQQGPIVSSFATQGPGVVAFIVENYDHANCAS